MPQLNVWHQPAKMHPGVIFRLFSAAWSYISFKVVSSKAWACATFSFFDQVTLGSQRVVKKKGVGGVFSLCVHICWVMCSLLLYDTYTHTLWILGFMEEAACSQLLNTVTVWFTKSSFHKGILTCCILDWQRQPLRVECLLLEDGEWWLFWVLPHSSRGYPTPSHLTLLISVDTGLVQSFSLEKLRFSCGGVPGTRVWVCVYRDLQATK